MKLIKLFATVSVVVLSLVMGGHYCYSQWIPSIQKFELERVGPHAKIDLPKTTIDPDHIDYFFEPAAGDVKPGADYPVVHLRIPKKPHFNHDALSGPFRTYGQTLDMVWPGLFGIGDPEGAECLDHYRKGIGGFCSNLVRLYIDFMWRQEPSLEKKLKGKSDSEIGEGKYFFEPKKDSPLGLQYIGTERATSPEMNSSLTTRYVSIGDQGDKDLIFNCWESAPSPACEVEFTASRSPNIAIKILLVYNLLPYWRDIVHSVRTKVDGMIVGNYSLKIKEQ